ncbi:hypothetical protein PL10110_240013 [Planktothrix agardhii]|nr:hypothetical protein PL10110_240013 [Planktothrix agardhii]
MGLGLAVIEDYSSVGCVSAAHAPILNHNHRDIYYALNLLSAIAPSFEQFI